MYEPSSAKTQADFLLDVLLQAKRSKINLSGKILRDLLDVIEGTRRGHLNRKQNYTHATFKTKCRFRSERAIAEFKTDPSNAVKTTIRDHALPLKKLVQLLAKTNIETTESLWRFLDTYLVSVIITKDENRLLTESGWAHEMPPDSEDVNIFARYARVGIQIIDTETSKPLTEWSPLCKNL